MAGHVETPTRSFVSNAAIGPYLRVKLTGGKYALAVLADMELGTTEQESFAANEVQPIRLRNAQGTRKMVANAALAVGAEAYTAAAGKVGAAATGAFREGIVLTASAADGDIIEVAFDPGDNAHA